MTLEQAARNLKHRASDVQFEAAEILEGRPAFRIIEKDIRSLEDAIAVFRSIAADADSLKTKGSE